MKKCPNCGADLDDNARFCSNCGESLSGKKSAVKIAAGIGKVFLIFVGMVLLFFVVMFAISTISGNIDDARRDNARATETAIVKTEVMRITETWIAEGRPTRTPTVTPTPRNTPSSDAAGVDPDLKAWLDSYETFMGEYAAMMLKREDFMKELDAWNMDDMSSVDFAYFMEALDRVDKVMQSTY